MKLELASVELVAILSNYYAQLERRLETAANTRDPNVRDEIAKAAFNLVLDSSPAEKRADLEKHREQLVAALLAHQSALAEGIRSVAVRLPRTRFAGPINAAFTALRRLTTKLAASPGAITKYCDEMRVQLGTGTPVEDASKLTWADFGTWNGSLYGTPETHHLLRDAFVQSEWEITANYVAIGTRKFEGEHLVMIACRSRPTDPTLSDVIYAGATEEDVVGINFLHHGPSDYVIGRRTKPLRYQILSRGNFARGPEGEILTKLP